MKYAYGILAMLWLFLALASVIILPVSMVVPVSLTCAAISLYSIARSSGA